MNPWLDIRLTEIPVELRNLCWIGWRAVPDEDGHVCKLTHPYRKRLEAAAPLEMSSVTQRALSVLLREARVASESI